MGEININDNFGKSIITTVEKFQLNSILEIGSWDGTGSTQCFINAMSQMRDKKLICLEVDKGRFDDLVKTVKAYSWVFPLNESAISLKSLKYPTFASVWESQHNCIKSPRETVATWYAKDYETLKKYDTGFLEKDTTFYDGVLIDGSEFTGYSEFQLLKDRTNVFFLDDYYNAFKTREVAAELEKSPEWLIVDADKTYRQGFVIFARRTLKSKIG